MDGRDVEPSSWLHAHQSRVRPLLCPDLRRALPRCEGASLRTRFRPPPRAGETGRPVAVEEADDDLRQLDERSVPQGRARRFHSYRRPRDATGELAYVPGTHKEIRTAPRHASDESQ